MSTSSRSTHRDIGRPARRHWVAGIALAACLAFSIVWIGFARGPHSEIRVASAGNNLSAQLIDDHHSILFATAATPADARAVLGTLARPWERKPDIVVAQASDRVANGLWETVQRLQPSQLIVLGAPGDSEQWLQIERYCREHAIEIRYLESATRLELASTQLDLFPTPNGAHATISTGSLHVTVLLTGEPPASRSHALLASADVPQTTNADLVITAGSVVPASPSTQLLTVEEGRRVTLGIEQDEIRVKGGRLIKPEKHEVSTVE